MKNYGEENIPTFSFKEQQEEVDENGNNMYQEFYNNNDNNFNSPKVNENENNNIVDVSKNIIEQMQENSHNSGINFINTNGMNFNSHNFMKNIPSKNQKNDFEIKDKNIQQQINSNIEMIQKFRKTGVIFNNQENDFKNENKINNINSDDQNIPQPEPFLKKVKLHIKMIIIIFEHKI